MGSLSTISLRNSANCDICGIQRPTEKLFQCSTCRPVGSDPLYYCAKNCSESDCEHAEGCTQVGHEPCWDSHIPRRGNQKHKKIDAFTDYLTQLILHSEPNSDIQAELHENDRKAEWFTVNSGRLEDSEATVQVTDRFRRLCLPMYVDHRSSSDQYPSLVSFIGDTGVGKSTLVNAMSVMGQIEVQSKDQPPSPELTPYSSTHRQLNLPMVLQARRDGPVTRSGDPQRAIEPTSSGVHLYLDPGLTKVLYHPEQEKEVVPILFADCEGFGAGANKTNAERSVQALPTLQPRRHSASSQGGVNTRKNVITELEITLPEIKNAGKAGAELYYARFLYAFSDVLVFVTNHDQQFHKDLQRLLEWAASAVYKAINHLPRKTLIVVQNMPARHNNDYYQDFNHKAALFGSLDNIWESSAILNAFKNRHDKESLMREGEIHTNQQFLNLFFKAVEVCYIPNKGFATASDIMRQYRTLRKHIIQAVEAGQVARSLSWTRYDVPSLSHLFGRAFHHFAKLPGPFDFYTAARKDNPMSATMADHIANLLRYMQASDVEAQENRLDNFPATVAVCLVSSVHRDFRQAIEPKEIFDRTLRRICTKAIQTYQNKYQRCAFVFRDGQRCKAVRLTHPEHCSSDEGGSTFPGRFDSSDYHEESAQTIQKVEQFFIHMFKNLCSLVTGRSVLRLASSQDLAEYRQQVFSSNQFQRSGFWQKSKSNKTCFTCLQSVPDHALPCGHVYCENCVKEFGQPWENQRYCVSLKRCVLCQAEWIGEPPQILRLKPKCAGVRVLTLDGGGVRGIIELAILKEIEDRVGLGLPISDLFDLVVGTSTGGIIALGLAMTEKTLGEMSIQFMELSQQTFKANRGGLLANFDPLNIFPAFFMAVKVWDSKYRTTPLREGLISLFGEKMSMFPGTVFTGSQRKLRVAVTSTTSGDPCIFANYNRLVLTDSKDFEREDEQSKEAKVWEAALATSAAPIYFKPFERGIPPKTYSDGALHANLPADYALWETQNIWPPITGQPLDESREQVPLYKDLAGIDEEHETRQEQTNEFDRVEEHLEPPSGRRGVHVDALVSIGTGVQTRLDNYPRAFEIGGLKEVYLSFIKSMDTESSWKEFQQKRANNSHSHYRLNVPLSGRYVALDDWTQMSRLAQSVKQNYNNPYCMLEDVQNVASHLVASLLFFEPVAIRPTRLQPVDRLHRISGQIWCRLPRSSPALIALTDRISGFGIQEDNPRFGPSGMIPWIPEDGWKSEIRTQGQHLVVPITIKTTELDSAISVAVKLKDARMQKDKGVVPKERMFPISGFPIVFKDLLAMTIV